MTIPDKVPINYWKLHAKLLFPRAVLLAIVMKLSKRTGCMVWLHANKYTTISRDECKKNLSVWEQRRRKYPYAIIPQYVRPQSQSPDRDIGKCSSQTHWMLSSRITANQWVLIHCYPYMITLLLSSLKDLFQYHMHTLLVIETYASDNTNPVNIILQCFVQCVT